MKYLLALCCMPCLIFGQEQSEESVLEYSIKEFILNTKEEIYYNQGMHYSRNYLQGRLDAYEQILILIRYDQIMKATN